MEICKTIWPSNCTLGAFIPEKRKHVYTDMDPQMFTAGLLITTKTRSSPGVQQVNTHIIEHTQQQSKWVFCNSLDESPRKHAVKEKSQSPEVTGTLGSFVEHPRGDKIMNMKMSNCQWLGSKGMVVVGKRWLCFLEGHMRAPTVMESFWFLREVLGRIT